jgi:hypothetical protein
MDGWMDMREGGWLEVVLRGGALEHDEVLK